MKIISALFFLIVFLILSYLVLGIATILKNGVSITADPGSITRLKQFLSTNIATTEKNSVYPELQPKHYSIDSDKVENVSISEKIRIAAEKAGFQFITNQVETNQIQLTRSTKLLNFIDDIEVKFEVIESELVINAKSSSRKGRADFGANLANIKQLFSALDREFE